MWYNNGEEFFRSEDMCIMRKVVLLFGTLLLMAGLFGCAGNKDAGEAQPQISPKSETATDDNTGDGEEEEDPSSEDETTYVKPKRASFIANDFYSEYWGVVAEGVLACAEEHGVDLDMGGGDSAEEIEQQNSALYKAVRDGVDFVILAGVRPEDTAEYRQDAADRDVPIYDLDMAEGELPEGEARQAGYDFMENCLEELGLD